MPHKFHKDGSVTLDLSLLERGYCYAEESEFKTMMPPFGAPEGTPEQEITCKVVEWIHHDFDPQTGLCRVCGHEPGYLRPATN